MIVAKNGFSRYAEFKDNTGLESHISTPFQDLLVSPTDKLCIQFGPRTDPTGVFVKFFFFFLGGGGGGGRGGGGCSGPTEKSSDKDFFSYSIPKLI